MTPPEGEVTEDSTVDPKQIAQLRKENAKWRTQVRELESRLTEQEKAAMTEQERAIAEAREQGAAEARAELMGKVQSSRILAMAAPVLRDPEDAIRFLTDLDPEADDDAIKAAIGGLVAEKPYLALESANDAPPIAQGQRSDGVTSASADDWLRQTIRQR